MELNENALGPEEESLVASSQKGDLEAFNAIVERYERVVYNLALRMLSEPAVAEDATQDAFISAFQNIKGFRGGSLRAWLLKIVANRCRDVLRSAYRRRTLSLEALTLDADPSFPSRTESPEDYTMRRELGREIQNGLETIPQDQRMVLVLVDIQGLGYEEAAQVTGASLGTVKSRLSRGRARLRDYLRTKEELLPGRFRQKV
ncbi:MAG: sigma-70 family RNA polymerase sigma factor [Chloroflexi bacterium]|nr:sigma-70 family RNA polymerase sigma factor [Chloroflexota bacterium]